MEGRVTWSSVRYVSNQRQVAVPARRVLLSDSKQIKRYCSGVERSKMKRRGKEKKVVY